MSDRVARAFARGDFATVRALAPHFAAEALPGHAPLVPLFAPSGLTRAIAIGSTAMVLAAWAYALWQP